MTIFRLFSRRFGPAGRPADRILFVTRHAPLLAAAATTGGPNLTFMWITPGGWLAGIRRPVVVRPAAAYGCPHLVRVVQFEASPMSVVPTAAADSRFWRVG